MKKSAFKKTPFYSLLLRWIACAAILCMTTLLAFGYSVYNRIMIDLPDIMTLHHVRYQTPLKIYSNDRQLIGQYGEQNRIPVSIDQVPAPLIHAFLAAEDERFFEHPGVDFKGLIRAGLQLALTGKKSQGGSTITMQITRNLLLSNEKTYIRKLKEIILALKIEREYSKNKILELYLNQIYMGHRSYGVAAAAHTYYGKSLNALSLAETAMIAGLPKAPSAYNPVTNLKRALLRRNYVLHRMLELNYISNQEYQEALQQASTAKLQFQPVELSAPYVAEMARRAMVSRYGEKVYTSGYHVYTTIDGALQKAANTALAEALHRYDERHGYRSDESSMAAGNVGFADLPSVGDTMPAHIVQIKKHQIVAKLQNDALIAISEENFKRIWKNFFGNKHRDGDSIFNPVIRVRRLSNGDWALAQIPQVEGAFVALNPGNGAILALTGGFDFARNQFNRVTQSKRQPGSGFKPFIYAAALEEGFTPASLINDEPLIIEDPNQEVEWRPENYNRNFLGPTSLRKALTLSTNIISVRLLEHIGIEKAVSTAQRFGFNNQQLPKTLSLALGSGHASPLQMARAYAAFANGGFLIQPYLIDRVETKQGQVIFRNEALTACPQCSSDADFDSKTAPRILSPQINFLMNSLLRDVVQKGTAVDAKILGRQDLAGKTGTTNDFRDAWFNGYTSGISASAWVGRDNYRSLGNRETGGKTALPMWIEFMKVALKNTPETPLSVPPGITEAYIDPGTGLLAASGSKNGILEYFQEGSAPSRDASAADEYSTGHSPGLGGNLETLGKAVEKPVEALF